MHRPQRRKRSCRGRRDQRRRCFCGRERGRLRRHWPEECHTSPTHAPSAPGSLLLSHLPPLLSHRSLSLSSMFPLTRATLGQFSLSRHLQPMLMSPFLLSDGRTIMTQNHNDNKPLLYLKKGHFSFPRLQSRSSASEALTV